MLILTEKPAVARTFAAALKAVKSGDCTYKAKEGNVTICNAVGHLLELYEPEEYDEKLKSWDFEKLPIEPKEMKYKAKKETRKLLEEIKKEVEKAKKANEEIVIATDPGREGEVIARTILRHAGAERYEKTYRFWETEALTEDVVLRGLKRKRPSREYDQMAEEGFAWKESDWRYGINLTRGFTKKKACKGELLIYGRVQTAVLHEIWKRENDKKEFKEKRYVTVDVTLETGDKGRVLGDNGSELRLEEGAQALTRYVEIKKAREVEIQEVEEKEKKHHAPKLYNINELEKEAYRRYGITPERTVALAQELYEKKQALSYPRTGSRLMSEGDYDLVQRVYEMMKKNGEKGDPGKCVKENKNVFVKENKEDHHALIPLKWLSKDESDEWKIWDMVKTRFVLQFLGDKVTLETKIRARTDNGVAVSIEGTKVLNAGWDEKSEKEQTEEEEEEEEDREDKELKARYKTGEKYSIIKHTPVTRKTKSPKAYNYASILGFMENPKNENEEALTIGIGTPATRHEILKTLERRKYVKENKKSLTVTELGSKVINEALANSVMQRSITAELTTEWDVLAKCNPKELIEFTVKHVREVIAELGKGQEMKQEIEILGICPKCGGNMYESAKGYFCANWPEDKGACSIRMAKVIAGRAINKEAVRRLFEKGKMEPYFGKDAEGHGVEVEIKIEAGELKVMYKGGRENLVARCPVCKGQIKDGGKLYYCERYNAQPKCEVKLWKDVCGMEIDKDLAERLFRGERVQNVICRTKDGVEYKAGFRLDAEGELVRINYRKPEEANQPQALEEQAEGANSK